MCKKVLPAPNRRQFLLFLSMWAPISVNKLELLILQAELKMDYKALNLGNLIKVIPHRW